VSDALSSVLSLAVNTPRRSRLPNRLLLYAVRLFSHHLLYGGGQ
jgi:hypothetical protein